MRIGGRPVPVEVELHRKARSRLLGILRMYAELSADRDSPYGGVIYVTDNRDVSDALRSAAADTGLSAPAFSVRALQDVVAQTREASMLLFARPSEITSGAAR